MSTAAFTAWSDQTHRRMTEAIRRHGCSITYVSDTVGCPCRVIEAAQPTNRAACREARTRGAAAHKEPRADGRARAYGAGRPLTGTGTYSMVGAGRGRRPEKVPNQDGRPRDASLSK